MSATKVGHGLAKVLGIKLDHQNQHDKVTRGESAFSVDSADTYIEDEPTVGEWLRETAPTPRGIFLYFYSLFPFTHWITRYNLQWFYGDLVAGLTVGAVVVPQSMAYAKLANLPVEFGLYSSFMGVLIYWFFATSKDITIGPVAVMSTVTGNVVSEVHKTLPRVPGHVIASALAVICGAIICFLGLAKLGWLTEFITLAAISAFMTGSAINIAAGQVPTMMGFNSKFNTRDATYKVIINSFKHLPDTNINAAMGLSALVMLYLIRFACNTMAKKQPTKRKLWFFISTLRTAFVILLYVMISWLVNRHHRSKPKFSILGKVPRGFKDAGVPVLNSSIISAFASNIPASVIVLLIEHISISKSFGRINNYTIDPSQELVAIGVSNLLGPFVGAYPATGSFSRTAIKSKAGVRTPFAGVITALVVLLAIYALPAVFFYIPNASLAAVIIHAVGDLVTPPAVVYSFWKISPLEVIIFFAGVFVTIFSSIENGIYTTISASFAIFIFRAFKARGRFLGSVKIHSVIGDHLLDGGDEGKAKGDYSPFTHAPAGPNGASEYHREHISVRNAFLPIDHHDGSNPAIELEAPYPGIFIYRFSEGYNYPNANHYLDHLVKVIFSETRRTNPASYGRLGDRPWNDPGPGRGKAPVVDDHKPTLKAIILDFSSVNNVDITSVQNLIDVRNQLDRYTSPEVVEWHFASINNRWTKRALASAGFGYPSSSHEVGDAKRWKPIFSVAEIGGNESPANAAEFEQNKDELKRSHTIDVETAHSRSSADDVEISKSANKGHAAILSRRVAVVHGVNRPLFHIDLTSAVQSAIHNAQDHTSTSQGPDIHEFPTKL
ncbi:SulP family sulfate permease [Venturia nashicola]|uniref:SulP family sulfate permease n=1 Tax=Venturia nashicola TaxID=86259 RepID=A0A4Z1P5D9_9PEZI|nr:SulP family sulfate permease [Venturia nashicola]